MQVNNERFYVVQTPDNSHVIADESEAINHLKQNGTWAYKRLGDGYEQIIRCPDCQDGTEGGKV